MDSSRAISSLRATPPRPLPRPPLSVLGSASGDGLRALTDRDRLADIEVCLRSRPDPLYHMGLRSSIARHPWARANRSRDWRIDHDWAPGLIARARRLDADESLGVELAPTVYALDATTIDPCWSRFPRARCRSTPAAVTLHTRWDRRGPMPTMIAISQGKQAAVNVLDQWMLEPGAFYVMDRGSVDFARRYRFVGAGAFLVTRAKAGLRVHRRASRPVDERAGVRRDPIVWRTLPQSMEHYPDRGRRVRDRDPETDQTLVFLTHHFDWPALMIAPLYKSRWRVEGFFKWIKQNLRIQHFFGTTGNAVKTPVWMAIGVYVRVAIGRKELGLKLSWSQIPQVFSVNVFEQVPLAELVAKTASQNETLNSRNQLIFKLTTVPLRFS